MYPTKTNKKKKEQQFSWLNAKFRNSEKFKMNENYERHNKINTIKMYKLK